MNRLALRLVVLLVLCLCAPAASPEQTHFSAEDERVARPVPIPDAIAKILLGDDRVKSLLNYEQRPAQQFPKEWFLASERHLSGPSEKDFVVVGTDLVRGANVTTFRIFRPSREGYDLLLTAPAHGLTIRNARTNSYRDIELASATAVQVSTVLCRFDGAVYKPFRNPK